MNDNDPLVGWNLGNASHDFVFHTQSDTTGNATRTECQQQLLADTWTISKLDNAAQVGHLGMNCSMRGPQDASHCPKPSEDEEDTIPEAMLKDMTSKQRRQLRNRISARKFRNKKKEYFTMIEELVHKQRAENHQLRLEVSWVRSMAEKLQKENDQLRLRLMLYEQGIQQAPVQATVQTIQSVPTAVAPMTSSVALPQTNVQVVSEPTDNPPVCSFESTARPLSLSPPSFGGDAFIIPSDTSTVSSNHNTSPPELFDLVDDWDFMLPNNTLPECNTNLSHVVVPGWDLTQVLKKESKADTGMSLHAHRFPLLIPALMSIVLEHTMSMATQSMISGTKLLPAPCSAPLDDTNRSTASSTLFGSMNALSFQKGTITSKAFQTMWEAQLEWQALREKKDPRPSNEIPSLKKHPLQWLQRQFCRLVYDQIIARYPHLEPQCQTYLPICQNMRDAERSK